MLVGFVIACTAPTWPLYRAVSSFACPALFFCSPTGGPLIRIRMRHDLSYGIYRYAFPVQQAIAEISLRHGFSKPVYMVVALSLVLRLALASSIVIQGPAIAWSGSLVTSFRRYLVTRPFLICLGHLECAWSGESFTI